MTTTTKPKPWNALRRRYGDTVSILRALDVDEDVRVIVFGDGSNDSYDWGIERKGLVEQHSDCGYGSADPSSPFRWEPVYRADSATKR